MVKMITIILTGILCCSCIAATGVPTNQVAEADQAKLAKANAVVHKWFGNDNSHKLTLENVLRRDQNRPSRYLMKTDDGQTFSVDPDSGEVISWRKPFNNSATNANRIPDDRLNKIAEDFAKQHYPRYSGNKLQHYQNSIFYRRLDNGVWDRGICVRVFVSGSTGEVTGYDQFEQREPIYISTDPKITDKDAETIALTVLSGLPELEKEGYPGITSAYISRNDGVTINHDDLCLQRLVWNLSVVTSDTPPYTREKKAGGRGVERSRLVEVDAMTGEVISVDGFDLGTVILGLQKKAEKLDPQQHKYLTDHVALYQRTHLNYGAYPVYTFAPPLLINEQPYLYVRVVAALLKQKVISENVHGIVVGGDNNIEFSPGSQEAKIGGEVIDFGIPSISVFGRTYIPLEAVKKVFGVSPKWDKLCTTVIFFMLR